jgi:tetratricopeptide (TPR) repeat protein
MLLRERRYELALGQIAEALRMAPSIKVLYHTKGTILARLAIEIDSVDLARRRLIQSEEAFRESLSIYDRDDYDYHGLAELYFNWAKRCQGERERSEYISKAEGVIGEGLRAALHRERLWILSAEIQNWLGDEPSRIHALENAVRQTPGGIIARYLLGRAYRRMNRSQDALDMLQPVVANHPDEFRACLEYALALLDRGRTIDEAIAVLRIGQTHGLRDPRFVATLGGLLFLKGEFTEALGVFGEARKREMSLTEARRMQFRPRENNGSHERLRFSGTIATVGFNFVFISVTGYPDFFRRGSILDDQLLRKGMQVSFEPAFSASGPAAENLVLTDH